MADKLKITSWNIQHLDRLVGDDLDSLKQKRREAIAEQIKEMSPDILCILEGPKGEEAIDKVTAEILEGEYQAIKASDLDYQIKGSQWIWFLVKTSLQEFKRNYQTPRAGYFSKTLLEDCQ